MEKMFLIVTFFCCHLMILNGQCNLQGNTHTAYVNNSCNGLQHQIFIGGTTNAYGSCGNFNFSPPFTTGVGPTAIKDIPALLHTSVYPIPALNEINIDWPHNTEAKAMLITTLGQVISSFDLLPSSSKQVDITSLPPGFFTLRIEVNSKLVLCDQKN